MELIEYLLKKVVLIVVGILLAVFVLWLVHLLYPQFSWSTFFPKGSFSLDILPPPRQYGGLFSSNSNTIGPREHVHQNVFNGYGTTTSGNPYAGYSTDTNYTYNSYTYSGQATQNGDPGRSAYLRNLSIYDGSTVYYGQTFTGEALSSMFKNSVFTVLVLDARGNTVSQTDAINLHTWSTPGFERFQATIRTQLPPGACTLVFIGGYNPVRISIPVQCR